MLESGFGRYARTGGLSLLAWRLLFILALVYCAWLALQPLQIQPMPFPHLDKLEHAFAFAVLAFLGWRSAFWGPRGVFIALLLFGVGIEVAQSFTSSRQPEALDVVADAAGALCVLVFTRGRRSPTGLTVQGDL